MKEYSRLKTVRNNSVLQSLYYIFNITIEILCDYIFEILKIYETISAAKKF